MAMTKNQKKREVFARLCDEVAKSKSKGGIFLRAVNRRIEQKKREQFSVREAREKRLREALEQHLTAIETGLVYAKQCSEGTTRAAIEVISYRAMSIRAALAQHEKEVGK